LYSTKVNVIDVGGEGEVESVDFGEEIVCCGLGIRGTECGPGGGRPPGDDETE